MTARREIPDPNPRAIKLAEMLAVLATLNNVDLGVKK